jgi:hypothetical protein
MESCSYNENAIKNSTDCEVLLFLLYYIPGYDMSQRPTEGAGGENFRRSGLSHRTLHEFLFSANGVPPTVNPVHRRPWIPTVRPDSRFLPAFPSAGGRQMTALQRLAAEDAYSASKPRPMKRMTRSELVDLANGSTPKKENNQTGGNPPPMFVNPAKERRGTKLSHVKGSSPQQLSKFRNMTERSLQTRVSFSSYQRILSINDLYKALLSVDFNYLEGSTNIEVSESCDNLRYDSLSDYKERQSQVLLVETMEGYRQSLTHGYTPVNLGEYSITSHHLFQTVNCRVTTAVRLGREWCMLTVRREDERAFLTQGDVVLLLKPKSSILDQVLKYGFGSPLSPDIFLEKGAVLLGIVDKNKTSLVINKQGKSVQLRCCLASKEYPLGYSPSDGQTINSEWVAVILHSILTVEREWNGLCGVGSDSPYLESLLGLNPPKPKLVSRPSLSHQLSSIKDLNAFQAEAIEAVASSRGSNIVLVQGPPGTGKTHTLVSMLNFVRSRGIKKILVCAPSNAAVDEVMSRYIAENPDIKPSTVLRVGRNSRMELRSFSLDQLVSDSQSRIEQERHVGYKQRKEKILQDIHNLNESIGTASGQRKSELIRTKERLKDQLDNLKSREEETVRIQRDGIYKQYLNGAHVIFGTLSSFGSDAVSNNLTSIVDLCVIDEAAQAIEVASLIPLKFKPLKLCLIGDPQQLPAVVKSVAAKRARFDLSLIERLQLVGNHATYMLREQYRMHRKISDFSSRVFYNDKLITADSVIQRHDSFGIESLLTTHRVCPIVFVNVESACDIKQGTSIINPRQGRLTSELVRFVIESTNLTSIGVITPYRQQVYLIRNLLSSKMGLEIDTVDAFQGREKEMIIFDCVRAGGVEGIGFLSDQRRLNVALTRAKRAVWIIGNVEFLRCNGGKFWNDLIDYCVQNGAVVGSENVEEILEQRVSKRQRH